MIDTYAALHTSWVTTVWSIPSNILEILTIEYIGEMAEIVPFH